MTLVVVPPLEYETCECNGISFLLLGDDIWHNWLGDYPDWA